MIEIARKLGLAVSLHGQWAVRILLQTASPPTLKRTLNIRRRAEVASHERCKRSGVEILSLG